MTETTDPIDGSTTTGPSGPPSDRGRPRARAWPAAIGIVVLLWLVLGVGAFGFGAQLVARTFGSTVFAAFVLDLVFLVAVVIVIAAVVGWQRAHGETLRDLGWRAPTRRLAIVIAVVYGLLWTTSSYLRGGNPLGWSWERPVMAALGLVLAFGEELAVRGFLLEQLRRARVPTWVQIVLSGLVMGAYHGVIGSHYSISYAIASVVLFALVSVIFVIGRRSLTPGYIAHAMTHVLGDPVLMQGILFGVLAMS